MNYYEQMNPRAVDDVLDMVGVSKETALKLYHALDKAEHRGFLNGAKEMGDAVSAMTGEVIERVSLREYSKGYSAGYEDGVQDARLAPQFADVMLTAIGASAQACGEPDTMPEPEFYQGDSGDETPELRCTCEMCRKGFDDNGMIR